MIMMKFLDATDIDDDGDSLIEIARAVGLDGVCYALKGSGTRLSEGVALNTCSCEDSNGITSHFGYELVTDISLAAHGDGEGLRPLGNDTDSSGGCQGAAFDGTFEGNDSTDSGIGTTWPTSCLL